MDRIYEHIYTHITFIRDNMIIRKSLSRRKRGRAQQCPRFQYSYMHDASNRWPWMRTEEREKINKMQKRERPRNNFKY